MSEASDQEGDTEGMLTSKLWHRRERDLTREVAPEAKKKLWD
jgi:hypothetical protein